MQLLTMFEHHGWLNEPLLVMQMGGPNVALLGGFHRFFAIFACLFVQANLWFAKA
jgi:hypothetical protein